MGLSLNKDIQCHIRLITRKWTVNLRIAWQSPKGFRWACIGKHTHFVTLKLQRWRRKNVTEPSDSACHSSGMLVSLTSSFQIPVQWKRLSNSINYMPLLRTYDTCYAKMRRPTVRSGVRRTKVWSSFIVADAIISVLLAEKTPLPFVWRALDNRRQLSLPTENHAFVRYDKRDS